MGERNEGLTVDIVLGLLQEDLRNLQALGVPVLARQFTRQDGTPVAVLALPGVVLAQEEDGVRLVLAPGNGTVEGQA